MKYTKSLLVVLLLGATCAYAQTEEIPTPTFEYEKVSNTEGVDIGQTIKGYLEAKKDIIELYDVKKDKLVTLKLDKFTPGNPERIIYIKPGEIAIDGSFKEVTLETVSNKTKPTGDQSVIEEIDAGTVIATPTGDEYDVWFILKRGNMVYSRVLDLLIKSVNGVPHNTWVLTEDGTLESATVE